MLKITDKIGDMYYRELNEQTADEYPTDKKKIEKCQKVFKALLEILEDYSELQSVADQLSVAQSECANSEAVRAYKMGLSTGQLLAGVKD